MVPKSAVPQRGQRKLPSRPSLEHLKSQAKDLLAAQHRGDVEALARIRAAVPAYANQSDDAIRKGPFALHDAQSAIAREHGFSSWAALREHVGAVLESLRETPEEASGVSLEASEAPGGPSDEAREASEAAGGLPSEATGAAPSAAAAVDELAWIRTASGGRLPAELEAAVRAALQGRGSAAAHPTPGAVPMLPLRNAVAFPGAVFPIDVARPSTLRAIDAALATEPRWLAVFSQRASDIESPTFDDLHPAGCLCRVLFAHRPERGAWILLEGVRWVNLEALEQVDPYYLTRITAARHSASDAVAIGALDRTLRERARRLAETSPSIRDQALVLIDSIEDAAQLADLVMANLPGTVEEKAAYAREGDVEQKLRSAIAWLDAALAQAPTSV